jgi:hypothetical protein
MLKKYLNQGLDLLILLLFGMVAVLEAVEFLKNSSAYSSNGMWIETAFAGALFALVILSINQKRRASKILSYVLLFLALEFVGGWVYWQVDIGPILKIARDGSAFTKILQHSISLTIPRQVSAIHFHRLNVTNLIYAWYFHIRAR